MTYARTAGSSFDTDYYLTHHAPLAAETFTRLGMIKAEVEIVTAQVRAEVPDVYAVTNQYWPSLEIAQRAFADPVVDQVRADTHHFFGGHPTVRFAELHVPASRA